LNNIAHDRIDSPKVPNSLLDLQGIHMELSLAPLTGAIYGLDGRPGVSLRSTLGYLPASPTGLCFSTPAGVIVKLARGGAKATPLVESNVATHPGRGARRPSIITSLCLLNSTLPEINSGA
jgi:hypothetical protein